jgi:hypothetical protein
MIISSIIPRQNHGQALALLGLRVENTNFPTVISCPFCNKTALYIYDDALRDDVWLNCDNCSSHGNIITFGAQIWKLSHSDTIAKFDAAGLCLKRTNPEIPSRLLKLAERTAAADKLWAAASSQLWTHNDDTIYDKMREFGMSRDIAGPPLIGVAHNEQIAEACACLGRAWPAKMRKPTPTIVFPYYELPGRISGFLFAQYNEELVVRRLFAPVAGDRATRPEAGYFMLQTALLPPNPVFKNAYFIVDDPVWALKLQLAQLKHAAELLPVCAAYSGVEANSYGASWNSLPYTRRFFYSRTLTPEVVSQAAICRGYVCPANAEKTAHAFTPANSVKRLANICKTAMPWQAALEHVFKTTNTTAAQAFASNLHVTKEQLQKFLRERTDLPLEAVLRVVEKSRVYHGLAPHRYKTAEVIERETGWYAQNGPCIINCRPVITRVIYTDEGEKYYEGYVKKNNLLVEFFESSVKLEKIGLFEFVDKLIGGRGELIVFERGWNRRALSTALKLSPPKIDNVCTSPGWHANRREFKFAKYSLAHDGEILAAACPQLETLTALDLPEPGIAPLAGIKPLLTPTHENAFVWAATAAVLSNLVAPILNRDLTSFAAQSAGFPVASACGLALGCQSALIGHTYMAHGRAIGAAIKHATLPVFISPQYDADKTLAHGVFKYPHSAAILKIKMSNLPAVLTYDWLAICPLDVSTRPRDYSALRFIAPGYIQNILQKRITSAPASVPLVMHVLDDLHGWLDETYGSTFNLSAAKQCIMQPAQAHIALMRVLNQAINEGKIDVLPRPRHKTQLKNYVVRGKKHWWLNKQAFDQYFGRAGIVANWNALLNCFTQEGVFLGEETIHGMYGLLIERKWCDNFWSDYQSKPAQDVG